MSLAVVLLSLSACGGGETGSNQGPRDAADAARGPDAGPPPAGNGIAADHPGDVGIGSDSRVIFADDFEGYTTKDDLWSRWDNVFNQITIATDPANVHAGAKSLQFTAPQQDVELSNGVSQVVSPELDVLYLRYYSKFDAGFDIWGSSHNGADISAHYFVDGMATPGIPADGMNKYLISYESWRGEQTEMTPGLMNVYIYHPEQRDIWGDHFFPDGLVMPNTSLPYDFGPEFTSRPNVVPELGRWFSYEVMLKANTPGVRDGRITCWIDGQVIADFPNLYLRDIDSLTIDRFGLGLHSRQNTSGETYKWYDDVVAATAYIGPMVPTN